MQKTPSVESRERPIEGIEAKDLGDENEERKSRRSMKDKSKRSKSKKSKRSRSEVARLVIVSEKPIETKEGEVLTEHLKAEGSPVKAVE